MNLEEQDKLRLSHREYASTLAESSRWSLDSPAAIQAPTPHLLALMELFNRLNSKRPLYYRLELRFNGVDWAASVVEVDGAFEQVGIVAKGFGCSLESACERAVLSHARMDACGLLRMDEAEKLVAVATRMAQEASLTPPQL